MNEIEKKSQENTHLLNYDCEFWKKSFLVVGVDEAGRGSLLGPIVVSAVVMPINYYNPQIKDSKLLKPKKREILFNLIKEVALDYSIIFKDVSEIEKKNPSVATKEAMVESVLALKINPNICLVDGKEEINIPGIKSISIIGGDNKSINIASASIMAKVTRDRYMTQLSSNYPLYNLSKNKGYADKDHLLSIYKYGFCDLHRKNYEPVKSLVNTTLSKKEIFKKYKSIKEQDLI